MNGDAQAREINIVGDCVWGVFNTPLKKHIDAVFLVAARANSLVKVFNYKLGKAGYTTPIKIGIGISYGRTLMVKAGSNGSGIADLVYMGDVVNHAAKLAAQGSSGLLAPPIMIGSDFATNLNDDHRKLVMNDPGRGCYTANVVDSAMNEWCNENCK